MVMATPMSWMVPTTSTRSRSSRHATVRLAARQGSSDQGGQRAVLGAHSSPYAAIRPRTGRRFPRVSDESGSCGSPSFVHQVASKECRADHACVLTNARAQQSRTSVKRQEGIQPSLERLEEG